MEWKDIITVGLGAAGTTLGILNYVRSVMDNRVRMRVIPAIAWRVDGGYLTASRTSDIDRLLKQYGVPTLAIEVINLSKFPITVSDIGLCEGGFKRGRAALMPPILSNRHSWPMKLGSREAFTGYSEPDMLLNYKFTSATKAYATTSCDTTQMGISHAIKAWRGVQGEVRAAIAD